MINEEQLREIIFKNQHEQRNSMAVKTDYETAAKEVNKRFKSTNKCLKRNGYFEAEELRRLGCTFGISLPESDEELFFRASTLLRKVNRIAKRILSGK